MESSFKASELPLRDILEDRRMLIWHHCNTDNSPVTRTLWSRQSPKALGHLRSAQGQTLIQMRKTGISCYKYVCLCIFFNL